MLTQAEANSLIAMRKSFIQAVTLSIPPGVDQTHQLAGEDPKERFQLDIWRGTIRLSKLKYQNRSRNVIVLVRLDIDSSPHTNPDGMIIGRTHLHVYREGYEARWAYPVDSADFKNIQDIESSFNDFCRYCHIENIPPFQRELL